jgi:Ca-activated chloride channel family protein
MNWSKSITSWEIFLIFSFITIYIFYLIRLYRIGNTLGRPSKAIYFKLILRSLYFVLTIIALLGPSFGLTDTEARSKGKDIFVAIDLSASMDCSDIAPTRLEKAKLELINIIEQSEGDRFGILVFSTKAYWQIPLTFDNVLVKELVSNFSTAMMPRRGSNLEAPLRLIDSKFNNENDLNRPQIGIIFTDGESFNDISPELKRTLLKSKKKLIFIGTGTEVGSNVLVDNTPLLLKDGSFAISKLDATGLKKLSKELNAEVILLNNPQSTLEQVKLILEGITGNVTEVKKRVITNNKYESFLLIALVLAALDIIISTKVFEI